MTGSLEPSLPGLGRSSAARRLAGAAAAALDHEQADRAIAIFNKLRLPDVPGLPTLEEACGDWFRDIVGALFGSLDASGERRIREVFALVAKKNSKTSYSAPR